MVSRTVAIVLDDPALYDTFLKEYPERIFEEQIHIDDSGERDEARQYWISGLTEQTVRDFLCTKRGFFSFDRRGIHPYFPCRIK